MINSQINCATKMMKKVVTTIITVALLLGVFSIPAFARSHYELQSPDVKEAQDDLSDVREYCEMYDIEMSESPEFVSEVRMMIDERNATIQLHKGNPMKKPRFIPKSA